MICFESHIACSSAIVTNELKTPTLHFLLKKTTHIRNAIQNILKWDFFEQYIVLVICVSTKHQISSLVILLQQLFSSLSI